MTDDPQAATTFWYRTSLRNVLIFALIWLVEPLIVLMLIKWMFHLSAFWYVSMVPWAAFGLILVIRPRWYIWVEKTVKEKFKRDMERFGKWTPPGFP